jgi:hypothetical protein
MIEGFWETIVKGIAICSRRQKPPVAFSSFELGTDPPSEAKISWVWNPTFAAFTVSPKILSTIEGSNFFSSVFYDMGILSLDYFL